MEDNVDYYCFTNNNNIKSDSWKVIYIDNEGLDNLTLSRKIKIMGNEITNKYSLTVYIDGAIDILQPISKFLSECCNLNNYDMVGFKHQFRDCIYQELNAVVQCNKDSVENAKKVENKLLSEKYPKNTGLNENAVLIRKNNKEVYNLMNKWYEFVKEYSRRDQLSFNYCLWKNHIKIQVLDMYVFDNPYFKHDHHELKKQYVYRIYQGNINEFDFHNVLDDTFEIKNKMIEINFIVNKDCDNLYLTLNGFDGLIIKSLTIKPKSEYILYNNTIIHNKNYILNNPMISFIDHRFIVGDKISIKLKIDYLTKENIVLLAKDFNNNYNALNNNFNAIQNENNSLKLNYDNLSNNYNALVKKYNDVINSKGWRLLEKIRKFRFKK
jgi:predicted nuclease with TOPRIM domain